MLLQYLPVFWKPASPSHYRESITLQGAPASLLHIPHSSLAAYPGGTWSRKGSHSEVLCDSSQGFHGTRFCLLCLSPHHHEDLCEKSPCVRFIPWQPSLLLEFLSQTQSTLCIWLLPKLCSLRQIFQENKSEDSILGDSNGERGCLKFGSADRETSFVGIIFMESWFRILIYRELKNSNMSTFSSLIERLWYYYYY